MEKAERERIMDKTIQRTILVLVFGLTASIIWCLVKMLT